MDKQLVNITLRLVEEDIEPILAQQPTPVQTHFRQRDLHAELAAYVLSRIPNHHVVIPCPSSGSQSEPLRHHLTLESAERQLSRERLIQEGIYWVLEKCDRVPNDPAHHIAKAPSRNPVASGHSNAMS